MQQNPGAERNHEEFDRPPVWARVMMGVTLALAWLVVGSIAVSKLRAVPSPPGCGGAGGCGAVLGSEWAFVGGAPVSVLAVAAYTGALIGVGLLSTAGAGRRVGQWIVVSAAVGIGLAAVWFIFLQAALIGAWCTYCLIGHWLGLAFSVTALATLAPRRSIRETAPSASIGLAFALLLIGVQLTAAGPVGTVIAGGETRQIDGQRGVSLLDGELELSIADTPTLGPPDASRFIAVMFDYACPHCRRTHALLREAQQDGGDFLVFALPMPLDRACNPNAPAGMSPRFDDSCELARLALAVHRAEPDAFAEFDHWLFEPATPPSADAARAEAERRVGAKALTRGLDSPGIDASIRRNIEAFAASGADRVPVLILPNQGATTRRVDDQTELEELLQPANGQPSDSNG